MHVHVYMAISRDVISEMTRFEFFSVQLLIFILLYSMTYIKQFFLMKIEQILKHQPNYTAQKHSG